MSMEEYIKMLLEQVRFEKHAGWNHCALNHIVTLDWFQTANQDRVFGFLDEVLK